LVIPAHDEEMGIAATIRSCFSQDYPRGLFEVVVIADNCTDDTAQVARREGARVVERHDEEKRSKGYAIEFLIDHLQQSGEFEAFDALVLIDADSIACPGLLRGFAGLLEAGHDWAQCFYTVSNPDDSWRTRLMTYAFSLFNGVTPLGETALGLSAGFRGNGMCLSTKGLRRVPWRCHGLVEDMEYSWTVRLGGERIAFIPDVHMKAAMLGQGGIAAATQRRRWEFGRGELRKRMFAPLLRSARLSGIEKITSLLELTMPSMVTLATAYVCLSAMNLCVWLGLRPPALSMLSVFLISSTGLSTLALGLHALSPFFVFRLSWHYLPSLFYFPVYASWKFFVSLGGRPDRWVRTNRERPLERKVGTAP
jgi:cellulose synthase/poly-beta-1,6-N-acetylglucosamine synthase-like glycosyltransferase